MKTLPYDLLQVLIAIGENRSFAEAAKALKLTQPSVSQKLKRLQSLSSLPLFRIEGKRKRLSRYGEELFEIARSELSSVDKKMDQFNRKFLDSSQQTIRICSRPEVFSMLASQFIFPGKIIFQESSSEKATAKLLAYETDIAISYILPDSNEIIAKKALRSRAQLLVHKKLFKKFFRERSSANLIVRDTKFLKSAPCIAYTPSVHMLRELAGAQGIDVEELNIKMICEDWRLLLSMVEEGLGYAIVPSYIFCGSNDILSFSIDERVIPALQFYILFNRDLKKLPGASEILDRFSN